jgi:hypothetical protein
MCYFHSWHLAYDNPAALNTLLQNYLGLPYEKYEFQVNLLYSVYSMPNIILPFFGACQGEGVS